MDRFKNTSGHPVTLDNGATVGDGEVASVEDTSGLLIKELLEAGQLVKIPTKTQAEKRKAKDNEGGDS